MSLKNDACVSRLFPPDLIIVCHKGVYIESPFRDELSSLAINAAKLLWSDLRIRVQRRLSKLVKSQEVDRDFNHQSDSSLRTESCLQFLTLMLLKTSVTHTRGLFLIIY